jgi:hypothetical protein
MEVQDYKCRRLQVQPFRDIWLAADRIYIDIPLEVSGPFIIRHFLENAAPPFPEVLSLCEQAGAVHRQ